MNIYNIKFSNQNKGYTRNDGNEHIRGKPDYYIDRRGSKESKFLIIKSNI